jgi:hypothetical protein
MSDFEILSWENISKARLNEGVFLWVIHADKKPPHIGISQNGFYFSLKVKGKDENIQTDKLLHLVKQKKIPCLIFKIKTTETQLASIYTNFKATEIGTSTCLTPILKFLKVSEDFILVELLQHLKVKNNIDCLFGINLPLDYRKIPTYDRKIIENRLHELQNAERKKHIFEGN